MSRKRIEYYRMTDNSMAPRIVTGDTLVIDWKATPEQGDCVALRADGHMYIGYYEQMADESFIIKPKYGKSITAFPESGAAAYCGVVLEARHTMRPQCLVDQFCKEEGLTRETLASKAGVTLEELDSVATGSSLQVEFAVAGALGKHPNELFTF